MDGQRRWEIAKQGINIDVVVVKNKEFSWCFQTPFAHSDRSGRKSGSTLSKYFNGLLLSLRADTFKFPDWLVLKWKCLCWRGWKYSALIQRPRIDRASIQAEMKTWGTFPVMLDTGPEYTLFTRTGLCMMFNMLTFANRNTLFHTFLSLLLLYFCFWKGGLTGRFFVWFWEMDAVNTKAIRYAARRALQHPELYRLVPYCFYNTVTS